MRIALASDAWAPQINGVVRTLLTTVIELRRRGHVVETFTPDLFRTLPCPGYPEIRLALGCREDIARRLEAFQPEAIHIATEGPIGWAVRRWCRRAGMPYTTSFHTRFPDYVSLRTGLPAAWFWPLFRSFHRPAGAILVATPRLAAELAGQGLKQSRPWSRGVDLSLFNGEHPPHPAMAGLPRPIQLSVGRVAIEKNLEAFLGSGVPGSKVVVGDGPAMAQLAQRYPDALFLGALHREELASAYAAADVFVFPSRTDTFGLVMIEALASGLPVAGLPVPGPLDILGENGSGAGYRMGGRIGAVDADLASAIREALTADAEACRAYARRFSWDACTSQFLDALIEVSHR